MAELNQGLLGFVGGYHGCDQIDDEGALIDLVGAHDNDSLSLPKKFSMRCRHLYISQGERPGALRMLRALAPRVGFGDDGVAVKRVVGDLRVEGQPLDERAPPCRSAVSAGARSV